MKMIMAPFALRFHRLLLLLHIIIIIGPSCACGRLERFSLKSKMHRVKNPKINISQVNTCHQMKYSVQTSTADRTVELADDDALLRLFRSVLEKINEVLILKIFPP